jgi:hypothetical protein
MKISTIGKESEVTLPTQIRLHLAYARGILPTICGFVDTRLSGPTKRMEGPVCFPGVYHAHGEGLTAAARFFMTGKRATPEPITFPDERAGEYFVSNH